MLTIRAMTGGEGYSERHLEHSDYYDEKQRVTGEWMGRGAEQLGLEGVVNHEQFEAIRRGLDPGTGEFLRVRQGADRTAEDGTKLGTARAFYDATFSAPKSVSIQATLGRDQRIPEAWNRSVQQTIEHIEQEAAATRVRQNGANDDRYTRNVVAAVYQHDTSRELDPQLHSHALFFNLTYDETEERWKALQFSEVYRDRAYFTEVQRNYFVQELERLGYEIDHRPDRSEGYEIRGVPQEMLDRYSQRSKQRDEAIETFTKEYGRVPTNNEVAVLVRETRQAKLAEISTEDVYAQAAGRLAPGEQTHLHAIRERSLELSRERMLVPELNLSGARESLEHGKAHVFERVSVARDREVFTEALQHGRGQIDLSNLQRELQTQAENGAVLQSGREIATQATLRREQQMIAAVDRGMNSYALIGRERFLPAQMLSEEQRGAVAFVLDSRDLVMNLRGAAGTGKTATLSEIRRGIEEAGGELIAVAPTRSAVEELENVGFEKTMTIERLLQDERAQRELRGKVLLVDEAGMVSSRQMAELVRLAEAGSTRLLLSGDTRQIQSVEAGDALRTLERESNLKSYSLTQVRRQTNQEYRAAVEELRRDPEAGFERLERMGAIHEVPYLDRPQQVAEAYRQAQEVSNIKGQRSRVLVVAPTHDEIGRVTHAIRATRKERGELGASAALERHVPLNWTEAQKRDARRYAPGQVLHFHKAVSGIGRNESLEVVRVVGCHIVACKQDGHERSLTAKQAKAFAVFEKQQIDIAPGDRLQLEANRRAGGFRASNGELVTVASVDDQKRVHLEDGRVLPEDYRQFRHGYAITSHRAQGKGVGRVIVSGDWIGKELFYVAVSRGREGLQVFTSDPQELKESIALSGERRSAIEIARETSNISRQRQPEGLEIVRETLRKEREIIPVNERTAQLESIVEPATLSYPERKRGHDRSAGHGMTR